MAARRVTPEEIADEIRQQIETGVLRYHERLPDAATMAAQWRTTKSAARRAIAILRDECLLDSVRRVTEPGWERARRDVNARRRANLPIAGDRTAVGQELTCDRIRCRNLAVWSLRSASERHPMNPRRSCCKHREEVREHMLRRVAAFLRSAVRIEFEPLQDPYERPSMKRKATQP